MEQQWLLNPLSYLVALHLFFLHGAIGTHVPVVYKRDHERVIRSLVPSVIITLQRALAATYALASSTAIWFVLHGALVELRVAITFLTVIVPRYGSTTSQTDRQKKKVVFEFRDVTGNAVSKRVKSLSWNLTTDTDVNDFEWKLITAVDPDETITKQMLLSHMGPYPLTSKDALWSLGAGKETSLLYLEFYPTTDAKTSRLGINEIIVNGFPSGECDNNVMSGNSHEIVVSLSVMLVVGITMFTSMMIMAWWCQCGCFKRKVIEAKMSTQRTLRDLKEMYTLTTTQSQPEGQPGRSIDSWEGEEHLSPSVKNIYQAGHNQGLFSTDFSTEGQMSERNDRPRIRILTSLRGQKHVYRPQSYNCYEALVAWVEEEYLELTEDKWYLQGMDSDKVISSDKSVSEALAKAEERGDSKLRLLIKTSTLVV